MHRAWRVGLAFVLTSCLAVSAQDALPPAATEVAAAKPPAPEDWTNLQLSGSHLQADTPLLGEKDEYPEFTRELLQVSWRPGDPIDLFVIRPTGVKTPPAILYLYSYPSETSRFWDDDFCKLLTRNGFAAVGFVSALTGHRYHDRPMKEWFVSELQESLGTSAHDVQMILDYLATRSDIDMEHIGMFGDGSGATIAILASAVDPRIKALDLLDPWGDWPDWLAKSTLVPEAERPAYLKPEFLSRVVPLDPVQWLPQVKARSLRVQIVEDVTVTPKSATDRILATLPSKAQTVRYPDRKVFFKQAGEEGKVLDWIKEQVRPQTQPAASGQ